MRPLALALLVIALVVQSAWAGETWRAYRVGGLTLFVGTKEQNRRLIAEMLGGPSTIGFHPKGSRVYLATPDPGAVLHEFAHTFLKTWPGHDRAIPYKAWEASEEEVKAALGLRNKIGAKR